MRWTSFEWRGLSAIGDRYLRRILVVGAHAVLKRARLHPQKYPWLTQLLARRPFRIVAIALANKMARIAWAVLAKGGTSGAAARGSLTRLGDGRLRVASVC